MTREQMIEEVVNNIALATQYLGTPYSEIYKQAEQLTDEELKEFLDIE